MAKSWVWLASLLSLAACDQGAPRFAESGVMPLPATPVGFKCPSGVKQSFSDGGWVVWRGADAREKDICIGTNSVGRTVRFVRGIANVSIYQSASIPYVRAALATVAESVPGTWAKYSARATTVGTSATDAGNNNPILRDYSIAVIGAQDISVPAGRFHAIVVQEDYTNSAQILTTNRNYSFTNMRWIDSDTGVLLQSRTIKWDGTSTQWTTTALEHVS